MSAVKGGNVAGIVASAAEISMFANLRLSSSNHSPNQRPAASVFMGRGPPLSIHCSHSAAEAGGSIKMHHTYRHHIDRSSSEHFNAMREGRSLLKRDVETNHIHSPSISVRGELCIPAGPLPSFIDFMTLEEALHDLPEGARLACIKCVSAWRMGHLDAKSLREYLRSVAWQSAALQQCPALAPACVSGALSRESAATSSAATSSSEDMEEECDLLSEEEMSSMMCGAGW